MLLKHSRCTAGIDRFVCAGKAGELIDRGDNTYGGKYVINPSGGLISKGHPLGATGIHTRSLFSTQLFFNIQCT